MCMTSIQRAVRRLSARLTALCLGLSAALTSSHALADSQPERPMPDYDGRGGKGQPTTPGQVVLWVPRIVLFPLYVVSEYVIRRPLGYGITAAEKANLPAQLYDFFAFGPDHKAGIVPTAFIDFGFLPSVGLYAFWDDAGFKGHALRAHGSTWGPEWLSGSLVDRVQLSRTSTVGLSVSALHRPDFAFYGVGPDTPESNLSRYGADIVDARATWRAGLWRSSSLETNFGYRAVSFRPGDYGGEPSITAEAQTGALAIPDGYVGGYRAPFLESQLTLDTRPEEATSESGGRLVLQGEQGNDLKHESAGWLRYGATLGGFLDLGDRGRILSLSVAAELSDPTGERPVPFTELSTIGGNDKMPGFRGGRLYGRSLAVSTLRYAWPIWTWLDGSLQAAVGNVYGKHLEGLSWGESRFSGAVGIESRGSRDSVFQLLVGFGTETFNSGADVNSIRVVAGARSGF